MQSEHLNAMRTEVDKWQPLNDELWQKFTGIFRERKLKAKEHILRPGDKVHELYFVCEGLLRFYYMNEEGLESNKAFIAENMFAGAYAASNLDLPVIYGVSAIEDTTLLTANFSDFRNLFDAGPAFDRLGRKLAEWLLMRKELRTRSLLQQGARERYIDFIEQHADLANRIPQYHIAGYLGVTEVSLSRIKAGIAAVSS